MLKHVKNDVERDRAHLVVHVGIPSNGVGDHSSELRSNFSLPAKDVTDRVE